MQHIVDQASAEGVAPAITLLLFDDRGGREYFCAGGGTPETVYDLASLTKPLATAPLALDLATSGVLPLDACLGQVWGDNLPEEKAGISVAMLLEHSAGFAAHRPFWQALEKHPAPSTRRGLLKAMLVNEPLAYEPGQSCVYSDLGYMLLGLLLEEAAGTALEAACAQSLQTLTKGAAPRYLPLDLERPWPLERIAPCGALPGRERIHGQVEDENAFALGGVAGHAGLFGTAEDVAAEALALCRATGGDGPWPGHLAAGLLRPRPGKARPLGFDLPSGPDSAAGPNAPADTVGHLGFTGVSLWFSPGAGCGVVLLTNRVALGRDNQAIAPLRRAVHRAAWQHLGVARES